MTWPLVKPVWGYMILSRLESASCLPPIFTEADATVILYNFGERYARPKRSRNRVHPMLEIISITEVVQGRLDRRNLVCNPSCCSFSGVNVLESLSPSGLW